MYFKFLLFAAFALLLSGCAQMLPGLFSAVEDIETQEAISLTVDKEAIQKDTDVKISIEVTNKDPVTYPGSEISKRKRSGFLGSKIGLERTVARLSCFLPFFRHFVDLFSICNRRQESCLVGDG